MPRIPKDHRTVMPFLLAKGIDRTIDFAVGVLGATEVYRLMHPDGTVWHAQVKLGDAMILLGDTMGQHPDLQAGLYVYVDDVDATYRRALAAAATSVHEPADQFYGDRAAGVRDPVGNIWWIATHKEDVAPDELQRRADALLKKERGGG
jgi:PhnB protein